MRRMSFSSTVPQMRARTKTVTRRDPTTWTKLKPGDQLLAVEKAMGLPKGARLVPIGVIEIVDVVLIPLEARLAPLGWFVSDEEANAEGFDSWDEFRVEWQRLHGHYRATEIVRRIEFRHIQEENLS